MAPAGMSTQPKPSPHTAGPEPYEGLPSLGQALADRWPVADAQALADAYFERLASLEASDRPRPDPSTDVVGELIARGEAAIRAWRPGHLVNGRTEDL